MWQKQLLVLLLIMRYCKNLWVEHQRRKGYKEWIKLVKLSPWFCSVHIPFMRAGFLITSCEPSLVNSSYYESSWTGSIVKVEIVSLSDSDCCLCSPWERAKGFITGHFERRWLLQERPQSGSLLVLSCRRFYFPLVNIQHDSDKIPTQLTYKGALLKMYGIKSTSHWFRTRRHDLLFKTVFVCVLSMFVNLDKRCVVLVKQLVCV